MQAASGWVKRYTPRQWLSGFHIGCGLSESANLDDTIMGNWRLWSRSCTNILGDTLCSRNRANLVLHLDGVIVQTWMPSICKCGDTLGGCDWGSMKTYLEEMIKRVWRSSCRLLQTDIGEVLGEGQFGADCLGWRCDGIWCAINWLIGNFWNVKIWVQHGPLKEEKLGGSGRLLILV
jgi:hypothetical protein